MTNRKFRLLNFPLFTGIGQIMLQNNAWTGVFFLIGIGFGSSMLAFSAVFGSINGTITALILKYDKDEVNNGIYGFNAALAGVALASLFQSTAILWLAIFGCSILTSIIQHLFILRKIPAFTFPFILVTWAISISNNFYPYLINSPMLTYSSGKMDFSSFLANGFGQVIFQSNIWSGIFFFIGIFINRPVAVFYALFGILLSGMLAFLIGEPTKDIYLGLFSYNAVLCAITFAGRKRDDFTLVLFSVIISVLATAEMVYLELSVLTFPFVLAAWITLVTKKRKDRIY